MRKLIVLLALAVGVFATSALPAGAITGHSVEDTQHPFVGLVAFGILFTGVRARSILPTSLRERFRDLAHTRDTLRSGGEYDAFVTNHYPGGPRWLSI
jgi:hypothetical protein